MNQGRPLNLAGQIDEAKMDWRENVRIALKTSEPTPELLRIIKIGDRLATKAGRMSETQQTVCAALCGANGDRSKRFQERVERANSRANVIELRQPSGKQAA